MWTLNVGRGRADEPAAADAADRRVLFLGLDGLRTDALLAAQAPHLHRLIQTGAFARNTDIIHPEHKPADTVSGPGWSNLLTGVWPDKHGVMNNRFTERHYDRYPSFLKRFRQANPEAETPALVSWSPLVKQGLLSEDDGCQLFDGAQLGWDKADERVTDAAIQQLRQHDPRLMFVYLGNIDETGHKHGFHPTVKEYLAAIEQVDAHVGKLMATLKERAARRNEAWLTIVATDHGGQGTDHGGGRGIAEIRYTFLILHGPTIPHCELEQQTRHVDIAATALDYLGVAIDAKWQLDGKAVTFTRERN